MKGRKTGGRVAKNSERKKITFTPSQEALDKYRTWVTKVKSLDEAIIKYNENGNK